MHSRLLRDRLELTQKLTAQADWFRREFQDALAANHHVAASVSVGDRLQWEAAGTRYNDQYIGVGFGGSSPVFGLFHEPNEERPAAIFASAPEAAKAAVEYHRTQILSRPRYEIERQPFIGWEYESGFESNSPEEIVEAFRASEAAFQGGALIVWDRHDHALAAYLHWKPRYDSYGEVISRSSRRVYLDRALGAAAEQSEQRQTQREHLTAGIKAGV